MAEEKTVIVDRGSRGSGAGWVIAIILLIALVVGVMFAMHLSNSSTAKDNAITNAAQDVSNAANKMGDAAQNAANNTSK